MKTPIASPFIGLIGKPIEPLVYSEYSTADIRVTVARLETEHGKTSPRNWRLVHDEPRNSTGGCFARIFPTKAYGNGETLKPAGFFSSYGPEIGYGSLDEYQHAVRALTLIQKRLDAMNTTRGYTTDAADSFGRWLEAAGISEVWIAADSRGHFLSGSNWIQKTVGETVSLVRRNLPENAQPVAVEAAS